MEQRHKDLLRENRVFLIDNLIMKNFIDHVAELLTANMEDTIMSNATNHEQVGCFLNILERRGKGAYQKFIEALTDAECDHVRSHLEQLEDEDCVDGYDDIDGPIRQETGNDDVDLHVSDWMKTDLSEEQRQTPISERAMAFVAREAVGVMEVGKLMGFTEGRLRQFQASSPIPSSQISTMFSAWRSQKGKQATVENFVRLMRDAEVDEQHLKNVITREYPPGDAMA
ncbi:hypothetical protein NP493_3491g00001 [Ridgeia piscesae]|uniref:CARD domain-containing protein n=1 Tax=Ridgeia piscesae TaxID=27915 RepID=A0AAD9J668_RIDPI|nr:hypothetical protein NP493_3491g00001 [Ridgeia piscesae]